MLKLIYFSYISFFYFDAQIDKKAFKELKKLRCDLLALGIIPFRYQLNQNLHCALF